MTHKFTTCKGAFEEFSKQCIPIEAGVKQRLCMKQAFWAGLAAMRFLMDEAIEVPEGDAMKRMAGWEQELIAFTAEQMIEATEGLAAVLRSRPQ